MLLGFERDHFQKLFGEKDFFAAKLEPSPDNPN
jgi:hypothetical protein